MNTGIPASPTVLTAAHVVTPEGIRSGGWVAIDDGRIREVGDAPAPRDAVDLGDGWLLPGFVDLHMHGGGGFDVTKSRDHMLEAVRFHRTHGTTSTLVSLMAAPVDDLCEQLGWANDLVARGEIVGVHLEGPFLSAARCGAQNHEHLMSPDRAVLAKLLDAAAGSLRTMTVAPELPGALDLVEDLLDAGVVAAVGHTDASYEQTAAAFEAGARLTTHLFNGMGPILQRGPGPAVAALDTDAVVVELINDGMHLHPALVRLVARLAPRRLALITDAISAAGVGDGEYTLGGREVRVREGRAVLNGSERLAGSTLTMDDAVRRLVQDIGVGVDVAAAAAATTPASVLRMGQRSGVVAPGFDADVVLLDNNLGLSRVMRRGRWL
jgi:N-acetylglucosamine-6-phosphate deacetylase